MGVTTLAAGLGVTFHVSCASDGWRRVKGTKGVVADDWAGFLEATTKIVEKRPANTVIVSDNVESAYQQLTRDLCVANEWRAPSDGSYGLGPRVIKDTWEQWYRVLLRGGGFVLTNLSRRVTVETRLGSYSRLEPAVESRALEPLLPELDATIACTYSTDGEGNTARYAHLVGREDIMAGVPGARYGQIPLAATERIRKQLENSP